MKKIIISVTVIVLLFTYLLWPEKVITFPPGVTAAELPKQINLTNPKTWQKDEFNFTALAEYNITARVLSRNDFSIGKESDLSPVDFVLAWGPMSDQAVIDKIKITQRNRWYHWETDEYPIPLNQIGLNSANVHIVPKDEAVVDKLDEVSKGSLVEMKGYLVEITTTEGWHWKSSLSRDDTGGGACELFWVEELIIKDPE